MSMMEHMMSFMMERMSKEDKESMMDSMMEKFFADITPSDKQKMMADMMPKMMEGMDMADMMPKMMMGMMSGDMGETSDPMPGMMGKMMGGSGHSGMPDMMLKMMPKCIEMMLPSLPADKRDDAAARLVSAIVEHGSAGMSEDDRRSFLGNLEEVLAKSARTPSESHADATP